MPKSGELSVHEPFEANVSTIESEFGVPCLSIMFSVPPRLAAIPKRFGVFLHENQNLTFCFFAPTARSRFAVFQTPMTQGKTRRFLDFEEL